ncbi:NYN domain-containing protein [Modestobacter muralis]|uniref:NYN domain-containing protein n=1 Tax=Modestobacter muralis TaxID=1608614 RepID=A0A6P0F0G6_9ACTN|nr:NYN domain-containing protein [Modestobacter muralis]NEK96613.1 NYN domain-containing protein [Modestobacter muralis]NEN53532.1 NYN domain-containing protein [Modestobacter muralis]
MADRLVVFIDYQNVHGSARRQFFPAGSHPAEGHIDPLRLAHLLAKRRSRQTLVEGVRIYRGRPNPIHQARSAAANDRQTETWRRSSLVTVVRRPLQYRHDYPVTPAVEKGIDVALAVDVVAMGLRKEYDAAIVFSSDTDLMPAIETVYYNQLGHIELATWAGANRLRFPDTQLPYCHYVREQEFRTIEDRTDYTIP